MTLDEAREVCTQLSKKYGTDFGPHLPSGKSMNSDDWDIGLWNGHMLVKPFKTEEEYLAWRK